ncbi:MAG: hypothetical protein H7231_12625 [Rhodoferax sp.]|nr:hypothetical protein [Actinomycetota bacterium]
MLALTGTVLEMIAGRPARQDLEQLQRWVNLGGGPGGLVAEHGLLTRGLSR